MPSKNHGRMAQDMKRELIAIIGEMKDPRVTGGLLTVTRLDVTPDLDQAKVYISVMGREGGPEPVVKALNKASGHVRTEVSRRMPRALCLFRMKALPMRRTSINCWMNSPLNRTLPRATKAKANDRQSGLPKASYAGPTPQKRGTV